MIRKTCVLIMVLALTLVAVGIANASTSAEKQAAIDAGLAYLASTQNANGSWTYGGGTYNAAATGAALLAFTEQYYKPLGWNNPDPNIYMNVVTNATNYLLSTVTTLPFAATGNWWGFGAGSSGLRWTGNNEDTYLTGIVLPSLARLVSNPYGGSAIYSPSATISGIGGTGGPLVNGQTYAQVIQQVVDGFTYYQTAPGGTAPPFNPVAANRYGGWRYYVGSRDSDMSTTQWPIVGYLFAKQVSGVTIPDSQVTDGVKAFVTACQLTTGTNAGGVDYQPGAGIVNATHVGGLLIAQEFAGSGAGTLASAIAWLNAHWKDTQSGTWYGNFGHPYAMWAVYKGLEALYGTTGAGPITNLHDQDGNLIDPGAVWNWWEDYCQYLVDAQNANGSWSGYSPNWVDPLSTAWDINILNATRTVGPPIPIPGSVGLLGTGLLSLLGAGWWRRRKS